MSKTSTDLVRHALNGPTMGTRWSALFFAEPGLDPMPVQWALQAAVANVDAQMSIWMATSDLMRLNAAPVGDWMAISPQLLHVLKLGLEIGAASGGAFDIAMGDAVSAWGFGPADTSPEGIRAAMTGPRIGAAKALELNVVAGNVRKTAPISLDLNGIAKGYGVDRMAETLSDAGISAGLVAIDGEMRAQGLRPDGMPWSVAVEAPEHECRRPHSLLSLHNAAVATSGDYRHWVEVQGRRLSHTMDPGKGAPVLATPASVTVVARTCAEADAWATAFMVLGAEAGANLARQNGLDVLFLLRDDAGVRSIRVGRLFTNEPAANASVEGN